MYWVKEWWGWRRGGGKRGVCPIFLLTTGAAACVRTGRGGVVGPLVLFWAHVDVLSVHVWSVVVVVVVVVDVIFVHVGSSRQRLKKLPNTIPPELLYSIGIQAAVESGEGGCFIVVLLSSRRTAVHRVSHTWLTRMYEDHPSDSHDCFVHLAYIYISHTLLYILTYLPVHTHSKVLCVNI